jgi:carbamoyl-phosphate synthase large subunit
MGRRTDITSILLIGSGPIVIGQACEFDYSGTQACRALRADGYRVILANSNPATIMTDPDFADATYIEPLTVEVLTSIIEAERPDALLPTLGGQTALNLAMELVESGALERYGVELIGADAEAIATAEDRQRFKEAMIEIGLDVPRSGVARSMEEARRIVDEVGLPVVIRPAYILGGRGTGIASNPEEFEAVAANGLAASPITEILIEESIAGWKEYELEVMRDRADNQVVICSIENVDPMGVHTGDSITVAPVQTLSDVEYQRMRDAAFACLRRVGVETGGSNVQFAVDPDDGRMVVIEMNPRVSRSSALASKATGFPIAKIAAKLAVGYTLDEIPNDITTKTPASFEPVIDYVVTKIPRWAFEKFPGSTQRLGTSMQSVGEVMAIGRTFTESVQKACRSLELGQLGLNAGPAEARFRELSDDDLADAVGVATPDRLFEVAEALRRGVEVDALAAATAIDPWFLDQLSAIVEHRLELEALAAGGVTPDGLSRAQWRRTKQLGFSDGQVAHLFGLDAEVAEDEVRRARAAAGVTVTFKTVDTCAAEFEANTPYHYSTYEDTSEVTVGEKPRVVILGSGPNRIGQGIEFDYCCVHASFALRDAGYETVMVNCNPETVSTDYDTSDRLYFEPVTYEDVVNVIEVEQPVGVVVSLGGQTPLKLADRLPPELVLGTAPASIDAAEDRDQWGSLCSRLGIPQPAGATASSLDEALEVADGIGYPALVRPSYVLGGRAMEIVYDELDLKRAMAAMTSDGTLGREGGLSAERPVLVDRFLESAIEVDVDAVRDSIGETMIGGIMEHVEEAGVHSGDSACVLPPSTLPPAMVSVLADHTTRIADELEVVGSLNVQFAVKAGEVFVIEANPRASRTVPFVSKATGRPLAKASARVMAGATLAELRDEGLLPAEPVTGHWSVKEAVMPFNRFPDSDALLGPEMRSTGEVMGIDTSPGLAYLKSQLAAGTTLPRGDGDNDRAGHHSDQAGDGDGRSTEGVDPGGRGTVFLSLADRDKPAGLDVARMFAGLGFDLAATKGTADALTAAGLPVSRVVRRLGGQIAADVDVPADAPDAVQLMARGEIAIVVNTPRGRGARADGDYIRMAAAQGGIPLLTTVAAAAAAANGLKLSSAERFTVRSLQAIHRESGTR